MPGEPAESRFERGEEGVQIALHAELGAHREGLSAGLRDRAELGVEGDLDTLFTALEAGLRRFTGHTWLDILVNNAAVRAAPP